ncbi:unnamed protein product [Rotaria sp. Silwood1]|nr:unnamed protein product [Rotaria sp. Silwood1]CAF1057982.1 unnamed protein product [Rotaria sp. Silwood1]CAF3461429.1 unnamed protein product [Rotaria sp. Silwood1]
MNVNFNLNHDAQLCNEWLATVGPEQVAKYFDHVRKCEKEFKKADQVVERLEDDLLESDTHDSISSEDDGNETDS